MNSINLIYCFKDENSVKRFIGLKGPLRFYKNIRDTYKKAEKYYKILNQM